MCNGNAQAMDRVRKKNEVKKGRWGKCSANVMERVRKKIEVKEEKRQDVNMLRKTGIGLGKRLK